MRTNHRQTNELLDDLRASGIEVHQTPDGDVEVGEETIYRVPTAFGGGRGNPTWTFRGRNYKTLRSALEQFVEVTSEF